MLVRLAASGMCHSDEHLVTGDLPVRCPIIGGHEGAGVVEEVGPGVTGLAPGDHVVFGFVPACGKCPSCATGHSNLCDVGRQLMAGRQLDGTCRHHARGQDAHTMVCLGTFAKLHGGQPGVVREDPRRHPPRQGLPGRLWCDHRLGLRRLRGRGPARGQRRRDRRRRYRRRVRSRGPGSPAPSDLCHRPRGAQAELAPSFGATHTAASIEEAFALIQQETWGRMCDKVICAMGVGSGAMMASILGLTAKRGRVVVTNIHPDGGDDVT